MSEFECEFKKSVSLYDKEGWVMPVNDFVQAGLNQPERLVWEVPEQLEDVIYKAVEFNVKVIIDLNELYNSQNTGHSSRNKQVLPIRSWFINSLT